MPDPIADVDEELGHPDGWDDAVAQAEREGYVTDLPTIRESERHEIGRRAIARIREQHLNGGPPLDSIDEIRHPESEKPI